MSIVIARDQLGEAIHTGLRKGVDSKWASLTHSIISFTDHDLWNGFLDILHNNFVRQGVSVETIMYVFTEFGTLSLYEMNEKKGTLREYLDERQIKGIRDHDYYPKESAFTISVNLITEDDAKGLMSWLDYIYKLDEVAE